MGSINKRNMSFEERKAYRRKKRLIRKIQVYAELGLIAVALIACTVFVVTNVLGHGSKDKTQAKESLEVQETEVVEESKGLKVGAMASTEEEEIVEDESQEEQAQSQYSAKEIDSVKSLDAATIVSPYGILINNDTKEIVATKNSYDRIVPASMTKVLTVLVAADHITEDQLNEKVTLSHEAVDYSYAGGGSTSGFVEGEEVTVKDLFYGTVLPSGGDAAAQLAMYVAGDVDSFVNMMNDKVKELGLDQSSHFTNPVGFYSDDHYSTCYDMAIIMMAALDNPVCKEVLSTKVYYSSQTNVNPEGIIISNWFLRRIEDKDIGGEIQGAKTGYVDESKSCAVSSMISASGTNYICCTAKSSSSWQCIYDHVAIYKNLTQ
ncbi:MAG: D-alanyl-D-alanine carboxypeptidase [Pseudobutyrivibrio sp.]|nr:D-alanyl-D-alanine carboxypeptidase [Pseudobutyrivibrio sp.]